MREGGRDPPRVQWETRHEEEGSSRQQASPTKAQVETALAKVGKPSSLFTEAGRFDAISLVEKLQAELNRKDTECPWWSLRSECPRSARDECQRCPTGNLLPASMVAVIRPLLAKDFKVNVAKAANPRPGTGLKGRNKRSAPSPTRPRVGDG